MCYRFHFCAKYVHWLSNKTKSFRLNIAQKVNARVPVYKIEASMMARCIKRGELPKVTAHLWLMANSHRDQQKLV